MPHLFDPFTQRSITFRNRIGVSPMCMYSCEDGVANDWHVVHLGARAIGGAGMVCVEATAVEPRGRISPADMGIWDDKHIEPLARVARFLTQHGAVPAIQLAHAGRKAGTKPPWEGGGLVESGGWQAIGPSAVPFQGLSTPAEMTIDDIKTVQRAFVAAAKRALAAGFKLIELHGAHGYLAHSFYSPLSNHRTDLYGGSFANRTRFIVETATMLREAWPRDLPLWTRLSCSDWVDGGWTIGDSVELSKKLKDVGVDAIDCSSGGNVMGAKIAIGAGYQVPFAEAIKREAGIATAAVGLITEPSHADEIIRNRRADFVLLARQSLRDPNFPIHAAFALHQKDKAPIPKQYLRSF